MLLNIQCSCSAETQFKLEMQSLCKSAISMFKHAQKKGGDRNRWIIAILWQSSKEVTITWKKKGEKMKFPKKSIVLLTFLVALVFGVSAVAVAAINSDKSLDGAVNSENMILNDVALTNTGPDGEGGDIDIAGLLQGGITFADANLVNQDLTFSHIETITVDGITYLVIVYDFNAAGTNSRLTAAIVQTDPQKGNTMVNFKKMVNVDESVNALATDTGGEALATYIVSGLNPILTGKDIDAMKTENNLESTTGGVALNAVEIVVSHATDYKGIDKGLHTV